MHPMASQLKFADTPCAAFAINRFAIESSELKKVFESLIEKDYMERVEGQRGVYRYVA